MRELKQLKDELDIAILIVASSAGRSASISEADLGRLGPLCDTADSVFALGRLPKHEGWAYLKQTRSRNAAIVWNDDNGPACRIAKIEKDFLGVVFDERFAEKIDDETRDLICRIKEMKTRNISHRRIAEELGIAFSRVGRLLKKWTPAMEECGKWRVDSGELRVSEPEALNGGQPSVDNGQKPISARRNCPDELEEWEDGGFDKSLSVAREQDGGGG